MDLNDLNIDFHIDTSPRFNPPNQIVRNFRINALYPLTKGELELTEHGRALLQEYIDGARSYLTLEPEHPRCLCVMPEIEPRRKRAYCNMRARKVQAKRKMLNLDVDGRYYGIRQRRASLAYALAVEEWINGRRTVMPRRADYGHKPARVRRKEKKREFRWKPLNMSDKDQAFMDAMSWGASGELDTMFAISPEDLGELNNVNKP